MPCYVQGGRSRGCEGEGEVICLLAECLGDQSESCIIRWALVEVSARRA
uniref:Uncharacterized protein n=1 Tax=Zea mays TaxID=4577 RepID=B4FZC7_MAIZE|nr:unknown [Zea mays]